MTAILPWSRCGLAALASLTGLLAQPVVTTTAAPLPAAVTDWLVEVDAAFEARDLDRYRACFAPVHPARQAMHLMRVAKVFETGARLARDSVAQHHWQLGPNRVSLVRAATRPADAPQDGPAVVEHALLVTRNTTDGMRGTLLVEVDAGFLAMMPGGDGETPKSGLRCHACNYDIEAGTDWLMVPDCKLRVGCLESLSFYSLDAEVVARITVHLARGERMPPPARQLERLLAASGQVVGPDAIREWAPPAYAALPPTERPIELEGAEVVLNAPPPHLPREAYLATYGRVGYLLTVTGSARQLAGHRQQIDRLLGSFRLRDPRLDADQLTVRIVEERLGGRVEGHRYRNDRFGIVVDGVPNWGPRLDTAYDAFDLTWRCPDGHGLLRAQAFTPPRGASVWTRAAADAMVRQSLGAGGTQARPAGSWQRGPDQHGFGWSRRVELTRPDDDLAALQIYLDDDLLLLVEGRAFDGLAREEIEVALRGVRRQR